ncbi:MULTISPECIES: DUF4097 family beta strand repeat-containing protein [unclassified Phycicoccus]|uniref:DUF4097 family beta strand repeat-containing protein n=1 Tax=unclassified Phycicoccus TaxID=2637926 RepID=UPI0007024A5C|nr:MULTISPECIES: DUF4097 family beta strand repeat-containing protein [unclassified Phycicoccus]KQU70383.1 hypothetical protein ASC58_00720 [Phycicoccus sp. Root101]KQZ88677.1 hypothetical protein ASD62_04490 [Phycicoccus sp. Root563]
MSQDWSIDSPRVLDIGGEGEQVRALSVAVVGGRVDVVTHSDSPTARVEVAEVHGMPLRVVWDGDKLKITHGVDGSRILDKVRQAFDGLEHNRVALSISVPEDTRTTVSTVSAGALLAGLRAGAKANTVSGSMTLDDIVGPVDINTVSGEIECDGLNGPLKVNTVSGAVTAQRSDVPEVSIHTVSGDVTLDLVNATTSIGSTSVSGDVTVRAPHDGYDVKANLASGQVVIDGRTIDKFSRPSGGRLSDGAGSLQLKANAVSGNVVVLAAPAGSPA